MFPVMTSDLFLNFPPKSKLVGKNNDEVPRDDWSSLRVMCLRKTEGILSADRGLADQIEAV